MSILDHAKELAELIKKYNDQDLYARIVELREDNLSLCEELKAVKEASDVGARLKRMGNCYYLDDDSDRKWPYCLTCWDADRKLVSILRSGTQIRCRICAARGTAK